MFIRLVLKFKILDECEYYDITKYNIQGFVYQLLKNDEEFEIYHETKGFKFFNFSNIFPVSDFKKGEFKTLIISSPNYNLIRALYTQLDKLETFYLNKYQMSIEDINVINPKHYYKFISSTPVVLFEDNTKNQYYSFKNSTDFNFFFDRLKDNAVKKYNAFTGLDFNLEDDLFESFEFNREVAVRVRKNGNTFIIIGSLWKNLEVNINKQNRNFYRFLLDVGLGEKNSLGFGMLNDKR